MTSLSYAAEQVRQYDHDRFLTVIFAPAAARENLCALYAFNVEIAKIREVVTEPLIGQMRLQWWRDTLNKLYDGETVSHAVAEPLGIAIGAARLDRAQFDRLIDARETDLELAPPETMKSLLAYAEGTGAPLLELALTLAGAGQSEAMKESARLVGAGWALTGLLRAVPFHARQRRLYLPSDRMAAAGVRATRLFDLKPEPGLVQVAREVADHARALFREAEDPLRHLPRRRRSPALVAELGHLYLNDLEWAGWDAFALERRSPRRFTALHLALKVALKGY